MGTWQWCGAALVLATVYCSITGESLKGISGQCNHSSVDAQVH